MKSVWFISVLGASVLALLSAGLYSSTKSKTGANSGERRILYYQDPMHPVYTSDKPGRAPDCGMPLEPVYAGKSQAISVSLERQQLIGIRLGQVKKTSAVRTLRMLGRVALDERRIFPVTAAAEGWVTEVLAGDTGATVSKGQPLVKIFGREYTTAQRTFLYSLSALEANRPLAGEFQQTPLNVMQEARQLLQSMGMEEAQIQELIRGKQALLNVILTAPANGVVVSRNVFLNKPFERGSQLFQVGDLSRVWIMADVPEDEASDIHAGAVAHVTLPGQPDNELRAVVGDALPLFSGGSRTFKVRFEANNPEMKLRPDMFVDLELPVRMPTALTVPSEAVVDSGLSQTVFVSRRPGIFEPRTVQTGWRFGGRVQILKGLEENESIVESGNFLLNAESRVAPGDSRGQ